MLASVGARRQFAFHRRLRQSPVVGHQRVDGVDADVQVVLDFVEVAVVAVGDLRRDVALRDPVHILGGDVQRFDHRVQGLVDAFDDLAVVALVLGGVGAGGEFALHRRLHQHVDVLRHVLQRRGDVVDRLLHLLVVALVGLRDQFVDLAVGDLGQNAVAFADGQQDGIQHFVDALHDARVSALELVGFAAFRELPFTRSLGQPPQLLLQALQHDGDVVDRLLHLLVVALVGLRDQFVDLAVGDLGQNAIAFADGQQDGVQHLVDALEHPGVCSDELLRIGAVIQPAFARGVHQLLEFGRALRVIRSIVAFRPSFIFLKVPLDSSVIFGGMSPTEIRCTYSAANARNEPSPHWSSLVRLSHSAHPSGPPRSRRQGRSVFAYR